MAPRRSLSLGQRLTDLLGGALIVVPTLKCSDAARDMRVITRIERPEGVRRPLRRANPRKHIVDHAVQAQPPTVFGGIDFLNAEAFERGDFLRRNRTATTDDDADMAGLQIAQHVDHVGKILIVPALIGTHGDAVNVFLNCGTHNIGDTAVMAQMHDFGAVRLQQAADHIDGGVMTVEQRCRADETQRARA